LHITFFLCIFVKNKIEMNFNESFKKENHIHIRISENKSKVIKDFVKDVIEFKKNETHHIVDPYNEEKRWYTGISGESAVERLIDKQFIDLTIGDSNLYNVSDLNTIGLDVGVKTVESGKFPIIFKKSYKPQIIVVKDTDLDFYVCGLATTKTLNKYQSDKLILSPKLLNRGTKTCFYGFSELKKFRNLSELKLMVNKFKDNTRFIINGKTFNLYNNNNFYQITDEGSNINYANIDTFEFNKKLLKNYKNGNLVWL